VVVVAYLSYNRCCALCVADYRLMPILYASAMSMH